MREAEAKLKKRCV